MRLLLLLLPLLLRDFFDEELLDLRLALRSFFAFSCAIKSLMSSPQSTTTCASGVRLGVTTGV